jgi:hypothetical protein
VVLGAAVTGMGLEVTLGAVPGFVDAQPPTTAARLAPPAS